MSSGRNEKARILTKICSAILIAFLTFLPIFIPNAGQKYALISVSISVLSIIILYTSFKGKISASGKVILCAVFIALSVVGRFFPILKPMVAFTIICAVNLGKECGFFCGSISALISDLFYGMGPWTPFRMFAWGIIGLFAGVIAPIIKNKKIYLLSYGVISGIAFSLIMDIWNVLWYSGSVDGILYKTAIISAIPFTLQYIASNVVFLYLFNDKISTKLRRLLIKYGI